MVEAVVFSGDDGEVGGGKFEEFLGGFEGFSTPVIEDVEDAEGLAELPVTDGVLWFGEVRGHGKARGEDSLRVDVVAFQRERGFRVRDAEEVGTGGGPGTIDGDGVGDDNAQFEGAVGWVGVDGFDEVGVEGVGGEDCVGGVTTDVLGEVFFDFTEHGG